MGGEGSGRPKNPENMFQKSSPYPAFSDTGLTFPPTAHIKEEALNRSDTSFLTTDSTTDDIAEGSTNKYDTGEPAMVLLETQTASNDATIDFTSGIDSTYKNYVLIGNSVVPATDGVDAFFRVSVSGTFKSVVGDYGWNIHETTSNGGHAIFSDTSDTAGKINHSNTGSATNEGINFKAMIHRSDGNVNNHIRTEYSNEVSTGPIAQGNSIIRTAGTIDSTPIDGIRFFFSSGNVESGTFKLYGIK